ncbi:MAG: acetate--CoA ligase, partial [Deltaproteobacteria bacterium]|nr:acetate--CoA ligase [Deltaproteobacteria bacterium]
MTEQKEIYPPSQEFLSKASIKSPEWLQMREEAADNLEAFWEKEAKKFLWRKPWNRVLEWHSPFSKWFVGGELNISENCLDRHLGTSRENKTAILWEGEPGEVRQLTYRELHDEVCRFANGLKKIGIRRGDRVAIYMPMVPEVAIALLACARIGATHNVVFGGFSSESLRGRLIDSKAKALITADGGFRRGKAIPLKLNADTAIHNYTNGSEKVVVEHVIVLRRTGENIPMQKGRDLWWDDLVAGASTTCPPESLPSDHPLYILYTSGTTGKPKGVVHGTGGYLVGTAATAKWIFDLKDEDIYWCTADVGWVTGHSYVVYGPLANGSTLLMYEGAPNWPHPDRFWDIIERHKVTLFYTAPTAIRACIQWGDEWPRKHNLSSLRLLGTVGEPINPEVWRWYHHTIGGGRCPIVDTWWQTETGMILISPFPGAVQTKPGSATLPLPGIDADVVDEKGNKLPPGQSGYLILRKPWPAMLMTIYGDG